MQCIKLHEMFGCRSSMLLSWSVRFVEFLNGTDYVATHCGCFCKA